MTDIMTLHSPNDWTLFRLGQLFRERKEKGSDADFPPLSVTMRGIVPQLETAAKSDDGDNRKVVRVGDYVINSRSDRKGSGGISSYEGSVSLISIILEPQNIDKRFAHHLLRSPAFQEEFYRWGHGIVADLWTTRYADMKNIRLRVPDLPTQRAIADFLDRETARIDQLIEKREEFAALVSAARDSLIASLICGQSSRVQTHSSTDWTENRPAHWKSERTKMHFKERVQKSIGGEEELLSVSHINGVTPRSEKDVNMFLAETNDGYKIVNIGDIVINTMWGWMGAMGVSKASGIASPAYGVYRASSNAFDPHFLDLLLRSKPFIGEVTRRSKGINSSRLRIYPDAFLDIRLPIPPRDEQEVILAQIRTRTERENRLVEKNEYATSLLKEYRSSLITAAVTGQIDVTKLVKAGTADRKLDAVQATMNA